MPLAVLSHTTTSRRLHDVRDSSDPDGTGGQLRSAISLNTEAAMAAKRRPPSRLLKSHLTDPSSSHCKIGIARADSVATQSLRVKSGEYGLWSTYESGNQFRRAISSASTAPCIRRSSRFGAPISLLGPRRYGSPLRVVFLLG